MAQQQQIPKLRFKELRLYGRAKPNAQRVRALVYTSEGRPVLLSLSPLGLGRFLFPVIRDATTAQTPVVISLRTYAEAPLAKGVMQLASRRKKKEQQTPEAKATEQQVQEAKVAVKTTKKKEHVATPAPVLEVTSPLVEALPSEGGKRRRKRASKTSA